MSEPSRIIIGDVIEGLRTLAAGSVQCCVTSPPYWGLRDYGVDGQIGLEKTPDEFVAKMVDVFREVRRTLRDDGTLWLNLGDSYTTGLSETGRNDQGNGYGRSKESGATVQDQTRKNRRIKVNHGLKPKDLCMIPWRVALALQADGWWLRSVICWAKKSPMPESVTDRPTSSWEPIFLLAKSERYFYDAEAVKEASVDPESLRGRGHRNADAFTQAHADDFAATRTGFSKIEVGRTYPTRNQRNVWHLSPENYSEAHFATFPTEIPRRAIKAGTSEKGCCAACGAPWRRVVERTAIKRERPNDYTKRDGEDGTGNSCANSVAGVDVRTLGWEPTCTCGDGVVPCVVLEPFLGSGTSIAVARELGRHGVGIELNPEYAKLARERIGKAEKPATFRSDRVIDSPLFGGAS